MPEGVKELFCVTKALYPPFIMARMVSRSVNLKPPADQMTGNLAKGSEEGEGKCAHLQIPN